MNVHLPSFNPYSSGLAIMTTGVFIYSIDQPGFNPYSSGLAIMTSANDSW